MLSGEDPNYALGGSAISSRTMALINMQHVLAPLFVALFNYFAHHLLVAKFALTDDALTCGKVELILCLYNPN